MLGIHNIKNSVGALGVALSVGTPIQKIKKGLKILKVSKEDLIKYLLIIACDFYDDYAHHPTEIKLVLQGVKKVFNNYYREYVFFNLIEYQD